MSTITQSAVQARKILRALVRSHSVEVRMSTKQATAPMAQARSWARRKTSASPKLRCA
jgi:hypothetical protein